MTAAVVALAALNFALSVYAQAHEFALTRVGGGARDYFCVVRKSALRFVGWVWFWFVVAIRRGLDRDRDRLDRDAATLFGLQLFTFQMMYYFLVASERDRRRAAESTKSTSTNTRNAGWLVSSAASNVRREFLFRLSMVKLLYGCWMMLYLYHKRDDFCRVCVGTLALDLALALALYF